MAEKNQAKQTRPAVPNVTGSAASPETPDVNVYTGPAAAYGRVSRVSWGAVIAGTLIALMTQLTLTLLGLAIGAGTVSPATQQNPFEGVGLFTAIWWGLTTLIALFAGGWVAGRLAGIPRGFDGALHGLLTWGLVTLLTFYLLTTAVGSLISGAAGLVGQGLSLAGQAATAVGPEAADAAQTALQQQGIDLQTLRGDAAEVLEQADNEELTQFVSSLASGDTVTPQERENAITALEEGTDQSRAEAEQTVDGLIQRAQDARQALAQTEATAREVGEDVASGVSTGALWGFLATLLGAIVAALGGRSGAPEELDTLEGARA
jgi:hypothetical protein